MQGAGHTREYYLLFKDMQYVYEQGEKHCLIHVHVFVPCGVQERTRQVALTCKYIILGGEGGEIYTA